MESRKTIKPVKKPVHYNGVFSDQILAVDLSTCDLEVYFCACESEQRAPQFQEILTTPSATNRFASIIRQAQSTWQAAHDSGDLIVREYQPEATLEPYEVEYLATNRYMGFMAPLRGFIEVLNQKRDQIPPFQFAPIFMKKLRFYAVALNCEPPIYYFRAYSARRELYRARRFVLWEGKEAHFEEREQPGLLFDDQIDCLYRNGHMFVFNKTRFQQIFYFKEEIRRAAQKVLDIIKTQKLIQNHEVFANACLRDSRMQIRLATMNNVEPFKKKTPAQIARILASINREAADLLQLKVTKEGMLIYENATKWQIVKLLCDDYARILGTGQLIEAPHKRRVT